jgi:hypothetical protein
MKIKIVQGRRALVGGRMVALGDCVDVADDDARALWLLSRGIAERVAGRPAKDAPAPAKRPRTRKRKSADAPTPAEG